MNLFDLDLETQKTINELYSDLSITKWNNWLDIDSKQEFLNYVLNNSGLYVVNDLYTRIKKEKTNSRSFSTDLESEIKQANKDEPLIFCHTSGTTDSRTSALKWYKMSMSNVSRYWAPGMKAIFESSGLNKKNSVIIFVPSRLEIDGTNEVNRKRFISFYSSEFSQRIMLATIKPYSYSLFEYKNATNIDVISKILSLEDIAVISAPAVTILKWADINKFKEGIKNSVKSLKSLSNPQLEGLLKIIKNNSITAATRKIQQIMSEKLRDATVVFSISSLSENDWALIRRFMKWKKGFERFTNLYVASEVGPIASSLGNFQISRSNQMYILPLSLPVLENKGKKSIISNSKNTIGKILVSKMEDNKPVLNIDIGDVINIKSQETLPLIDGKILRSSFTLKYPINVSQTIELPQRYEIMVGDYFDLPSFEFQQPRDLIECINKVYPNFTDSLLLVLDEDNTKISKLFLPNPPSDYEEISNCIRALFKDTTQIDLEIISDKPVDFIKDRSVMANKVRTGKIAKGVLKKWPLYVIKTLN
ncbi:MAG: hypothetical protein ACFE9R_11085 [Candidatus Hermodarchaeota archaeon]